MKSILYYIAFLIFGMQTLSAQNFSQKKSDLPIIYITDDLSIHFRSPESVQYVDISTNDIIGDIPVENVVRIKYFPDSSSADKNLFRSSNDREVGVVTIVGQSYMAQYKLVYLSNSNNGQIVSNIEIIPEHTKPLDFPDITMTDYELKHYSYQLFLRKPTWNNVISKSTGMEARLNNIYSMGDYIFIDLSFKNRTNIKYDIDQIRFKIEDKKVVKATNVQEVEISPVFVLHKQQYFKKKFRNIFVFKKFTYPNGKVLNVQLTEDQISGRMINLKIDYRDLLNADSI